LRFSFSNLSRTALRTLFRLSRSTSFSPQVMNDFSTFVSILTDAAQPFPALFSASQGRTVWLKDKGENNETDHEI
jgi:hypothetical protein